ncbi:hypothetical protein BC834DRAFT_84480 [Gloeopeniophorella convolvens]|nr:hypothetical protein BC834DRAFT_84480 [Gloeopeniophorella convolvens]
MQRQMSYTHNFFSTSGYPNPPLPAEEQPLFEDHSGLHAQVQPTFDNFDPSTSYNMNQFNHHLNNTYDTAVPIAPQSVVQDATAGGSVSYGNTYQPSQLRIPPPTQSWETSFVGPTFHGSYVRTTDVSGLVPPVVQTAPYAASTTFDATSRFPNDMVHASHQATAVPPYMHTAPSYSVSEPQLGTTPCKFHRLLDHRIVSELAQSLVHQHRYEPFPTDCLAAVWRRGYVLCPYPPQRTLRDQSVGLAVGAIRLRRRILAGNLSGASRREHWPRRTWPGLQWRATSFAAVQR